MHTHVITRNPRVGVSHENHRTWYLHLSDVQEAARGRYLCQINTALSKTQSAYLNVVGTWSSFIFFFAFSSTYRAVSRLQTKVSPFAISIGTDGTVCQTGTIEAALPYGLKGSISRFIEPKRLDRFQSHASAAEIQRKTVRVQVATNDRDRLIEATLRTALEKRVLEAVSRSKFNTSQWRADGIFNRPVWYSDQQIDWPRFIVKVDLTVLVSTRLHPMSTSKVLKTKKKRTKRFQRLFLYCITMGVEWENERQ